MKVNLKLEKGNIAGQILIKDRKGVESYGKIFCEAPQKTYCKNSRKDIQNTRSKTPLDKRGDYDEK